MKILWRIYKAVAVTILTVFLLDALVVFGVASYLPDPEPADAAVVLGAAINTPALKNRSLKALELYERGKVKRLILSGGRISPKYISEAGYMEQVIASSAKASVPLILEEESHNTLENLKNSRSIDPEAKSVILVSDRFHLARAALVAKRLGYERVQWAAPKATYYKRSELAFYYLREMVALIAYLPKLAFLHR